MGVTEAKRRACSKMGLLSTELDAATKSVRWRLQMVITCVSTELTGDLAKSSVGGAGRQSHIRASGQ